MCGRAIMAYFKNAGGGGGLTEAQHDALPADNPHSVTKAQVGLTNVEDIKNNFVATADPVVGDDNVDGYVVGSRWINTTLNIEFVALDVSSGAAIWQKTSSIYLEKEIEIGDWNMDANATVSFAHGLTLANIRGVVSCLIRDDTHSAVWDFPESEPSAVSGRSSVDIDATNINLSRTDSNPFDNADFDSTSYNRGWVIIKYTP